MPPICIVNIRAISSHRQRRSLLGGHGGPTTYVHIQFPTSSSSSWRGPPALWVFSMPLSVPFLFRSPMHAPLARSLSRGRKEKMCPCVRASCRLVRIQKRGAAAGRFTAGTAAFISESGRSLALSVAGRVERLTNSRALGDSVTTPLHDGNLPRPSADLRLR